MKLEVPLDVRYKNADGPLAAYRNAEPWTPEMQDALRYAHENAEQVGPFVRRIDYHCPACDRSVEAIHFESVVFYGNDDWQRSKSVGEAHLITMMDCGHKYRREVSR